MPVAAGSFGKAGAQFSVEKLEFNFVCQKTELQVFEHAGGDIFKCLQTCHDKCGESAYFLNLLI